MFSFLHSARLSRKIMLAALVELALLGASVYGFWQWSRADAPFSPAGLVRLILLGVAPLAAMVALTVRVSAGVSAHMAASDFQKRINDLQQRLNMQDDLFHLLSDSTSSMLTIFDNDNLYWFVNAAAAREWGAEGKDALGKSPVALLGAERGRRIEKSLDQVKKTGTTVETLDRDRLPDGTMRFVQTSYRPLAAFGEFSGGVIACGENVTTIMIERERRENMLRQVIATLVGVVDRRDPYASGHSARVGRLARALAVDLRLGDSDVDAAEIAGSLMNFGKVLISRAILTKTEALTPDELQRIRDGILISADILSGIDFSIPVVPTLRQVLERFDGAGVPSGLSGDAILMTARIVAVANAFVAMVSPRAYRAGADFAVAVERLAQDSGKAFDGRVIAALDGYLKKQAGKLDWLAVTKSPLP